MADAQQQKVRINEFQFPSYETKDHEGLEQVFDNLLKFQQSIDVIDSKVNQSADQYKQKLTEILNRIDLCRIKIICLNKVQQAMVFHSPNKFIKQHKFMENPKDTAFQSLKKSILPQRLDPNQSSQMYHDPKLHGKQPDMNKDDLVHMFLYSNYKFSQKRRNQFDGKNSITNNHQTLTDYPPRNLRYVESYMVFNSNVNPYKMKKKVENLIFQQNKAKKEKVDDQKIELYQAPTALKEQLERYEAQNFNYVAEYKDAPVFNFGEGLDEYGLGNIVSLDYDIGNQNIFAPSKDNFNKNIIPEPQFLPNQANLDQIPQNTFQAIQNLTQKQPGQQNPQSSQVISTNNSAPQNNQQLQSQPPLNQSNPNVGNMQQPPQLNTLNNGSQAPNLLNGGPQAPNLLNSMPQAPNLLNGGPQAPNLLNSMPQAPNLLNGGPQAPNLLNSMPQAPNLLNGGPQAPNLLNSMPQAPNLLNGGPQAPNLLNSMPQAPNLLNGGPPQLNVQPQVMQQPPQQSSSSGGGRSELLEQIRNPGIRLKKRVTVEKGVDPKPKEGGGDGDKGGGKSGPGGGVSMMDHLKKQIAMRHKALHPAEPTVKKTKKDRIKGGDSDQEDEDD